MKVLAQTRAPREGYPFPHAWDASRYPAQYLQLGLSEDDVVDACVVWLTARWKARVTRIEVGNRRQRGHAARIIAALGGDPRKVQGGANEMEAGIADLHATFPHLGGRAGWFEVKRPGRYRRSRAGVLVQVEKPGQPTDEQLAFLLGEYRAGAVVGVVWRREDIDAAMLATGAADHVEPSAEP